jgi:hypothetical protein
MKKLLLTVSLVWASAQAFADGRVIFGNLNHPVTLASENILSLDLAGGWGGKAVPVPYGSGVQLPSGVHLVAGLYAGATSGSETLVTTVSISDGLGVDDGYLQLLNIKLPGLPGGATTYFHIDVWDSSFPSPIGSTSYFGTSGEFTAIPTDAPRPPTTLYLNSTWAPGPLFVSLIPEPGTSDLLGLGAAVMCAIRRRRS